MKNTKQILQKFYKRLTIEAILRSLIIGSIIGLSTALVGVMVSYIFDLNIAIIFLLIGLFVCIVATICCFLLKYKPSKLDLATRVDVLGLEERVLTMTELEGNVSYMAKLQRGDAEKFIVKVQKQKLSFVINKVLAIICGCVCAVSFTVAGLVVASQEGFVPSFSDVVEGLQDNLSGEEFSVAYLTDGGGMVLGAVYQVVSRGQNSDEVVALADDGYEFVEWSDGYADPIRCDYEVRANIEVYALFNVITISDGTGGSLDDSLNIPDMDLGGEIPDGMTGSLGGEYSDNNQVLDGETHYKDVYENYKENAQNELNDNLVSDDIRDFLESYLDAL